MAKDSLDAIELDALQREAGEIMVTDKLRLDREWEHIPRLYLKWALRLEEAESKVKDLKVEVDLVYAELDQDIRNNVGDEEKKPTEGSIKAQVLTDEKYQKKRRRLMKAERLVGILQATVRAIDYKKKGLEKLVDLHGQQYFSRPRATEATREEMEHVEKSAARSGLKKRRQDG